MINARDHPGFSPGTMLAIKSTPLISPAQLISIIQSQSNHQPETAKEGKMKKKIGYFLKNPVFTIWEKRITSFKYAGKDFQHVIDLHDYMLEKLVSLGKLPKDTDRSFLAPGKWGKIMRAQLERAQGFWRACTRKEMISEIISEISKEFPAHDTALSGEENLKNNSLNLVWRLLFRSSEWEILRAGTGSQLAEENNELKDEVRFLTAQASLHGITWEASEGSSQIFKHRATWGLAPSNLVKDMLEG